MNPELEVLHEVSAHGNEYAFLYGGPDAFLLRMTGPVTSSVRPELSEGGPPTLLETYLALAPEGDPPDPKLVDYHLQETRVLGRPDNSVLQARLNSKVRIDKNNVDLCRDYAASKLRGWNGAWALATSGTAFSRSFTQSTPIQTLPIAVATCNIQGTNTVSVLSYSKWGSSPDWAYLGPSSLAPNKSVYWEWGQTSSAKQLKMVASNGASSQIANAFYVLYQ